jgi:manganese transport protein
MQKEQALDNQSALDRSVTERDTRAAPGPHVDPYALHPDWEEAPPATLRTAIARIGPGMVLAAAIVGSGELIATTTLGAQVGYAALWIILGSCAIKPVVQAELGRYTIATGETTLEGFNRMPGPRLGVSWLVWCWAIMVWLTMLQVGGMYGGVAQVLHLLMPFLSTHAWVGVILVLTLALLLGGGYDRIERFSVFKVALFTMLTICAALVLFGRPEYFSFTDMLSGLKPQLPAAGLATAIAVFGITGVGATELVMYPYWCVEKGYARFAGRRDGSAAWAHRARGWIRVMQLDIVCSLVIYTLATIAFYLLGAGVLHGMGVVPKAGDMIPVLSNIYTQTLGGWALWAFYAGAIVTLYGTIFAATAAHSRTFADLARVVGAYDRTDYQRRVFYRRLFTVALCITPASLYWFFASPVLMVVAGGIAQAVMLPLIGITITYLHRRHIPADVRASMGTSVGLWISTTVMIAAVLGYLWFTLRG